MNGEDFFVSYFFYVNFPSNRTSVPKRRRLLNLKPERKKEKDQQEKLKTEPIKAQDVEDKSGPKELKKSTETATAS